MFHIKLHLGPRKKEWAKKRKNKHLHIKLFNKSWCGDSFIQSFGKSPFQDLDSGSQDHGVCSLSKKTNFIQRKICFGSTNLDTNLESVPDGEVSSGLVDHVIHLNGSLIHKVGRVELVVVVEPNNPLCHSVHVRLVRHMVGCSTVQNLTICFLWKTPSTKVSP